MRKWLRCWLAQSILFDRPLDKLKLTARSFKISFWIHALLFWIYSTGLAFQLAASCVRVIFACFGAVEQNQYDTCVWRKTKQLQERSRLAFQVFTCLTKVVTRETHQSTIVIQEEEAVERQKEAPENASSEDIAQTLHERIYLKILYLKNISGLRWLFRWLGQEEEASARKKQVGFGNAHVIMLVFAWESHMHVSACPRVSMHDSTYSKQSLQSWISLWGGRSSCQEEAGAQGDNACKIT